MYRNEAPCQIIVSELPTRLIATNASFQPNMGITGALDRNNFTVQKHQTHQI